jgi:hypothetical protein
VIRCPWLPASMGQRSQEIVELVDLYRTVLDLASVPLPTGDSYPIEGTSLAPLLRGAPWKSKVALTMYPRCPPNSTPGQDWRDDACIHSVERSEFAFMGLSMRLDAHYDGNSYRWTEWVAWNGSSLSPIFQEVHATELYNHSEPCDRCTIFDCFENVNVAAHAPLGLLSELRATLRSAFGH